MTKGYSQFLWCLVIPKALQSVKSIAGLKQPISNGKKVSKSQLKAGAGLEIVRTEVNNYKVHIPTV